MTLPSESTSPTQQTPPPDAAKKPVPVVQASVGRRLSISVLAVLAISAVASAVVIRVSKDASWWSAWQAGTVVAVLAVLASLAVIRQAIGKPVSVMPAVTMLLSAVRLGISLSGLIVAVKAYKMPPEPTAVMICGYYAVVLVVESFVMHRALRQMPQREIGPAAVEGTK